ncbi:MAG: ABC transporter permease [Lachnospiraceae bacterium]|nr:ABC transporter permease [Lachnospiraceae bacterium]
MRDPLRKRLLRELREDWSKYLAIFLIFLLSIAFVSGFLVADGSMIAAYNGSFEKYRIEDGHFITRNRLNLQQKRALEKSGVSLTDLFFADLPVAENESTVRVYANRSEVDLACLMEGRLASVPGEIAIDRMYADNNGIGVGDVLTVGGTPMTVVGKVALPDYSALFENNADSMFDAVRFCVGVVSRAQFDAFPANKITWSYAWSYPDAPSTEAEERERADEFLKDFFAAGGLEEWVPRYANQAITFTGDDLGGDRAMMLVLLYMIIAIVAFIFGITVENTIVKEAAVIGTLRASGYTRRELILHYLTLPALITLAAAMLGNLLGYTVLKNVCVSMYYGSYSLPTYVTVWSGEAFVLTTLIPGALVLVISWLLLQRKLRLSPLKFLRRDLSKRRSRRAVRLSPALPFITRFRLRIIFQNLGSYLILFAGILFADLLLMFGLGLPVTLDHFQKNLETGKLSEYQYILKVPVEAMNEEEKLKSMVSFLWYSHEVETETPGAEKFSAYSLNTLGNEGRQEEVMFYGVEDGSAYVDVKMAPGDFMISRSMADKYRRGAGDTFTFTEPYEDRTYTFTITGISDYSGAVAVFMPRSDLNRVFDLGSSYFSGYFSDQPITDIDEKYIGTVIDLESLSKISRQLDVSMGSMMGLVNGFAIIIYFVVIYVLSKMIIEKNAQSISMVKILGYTNAEIARLYLLSTTIAAVVSMLAALPIVGAALREIFHAMLMWRMTGWMYLYIGKREILTILLLGLLTYLAVAALEMRRIRRIPMDQALKNVE